MIGIHTLWSAPRRSADKPILFSRLEMLVWVYGILAFRARNGPIWLYTDAEGRDFVGKTGIGAFYEKIILLPARLADAIDPKMFWAAAKLIGLAETPCPCVNMDFDAVLFQKMKIWAYCAAGHLEPNDWDYYAADEKLYRRIGLDNFGCWSAAPVNASVVGWRSNECRLFYAQTAIGFMENLSARKSDWPDMSATKSNPMVFAEQKLLGMTMARLGHTVQAIGKLRGNIPALQRPSNMYHLWALKSMYLSAPPDLVRSRAIAFIERTISKEFSSSAWVLNMLPEDCGACAWAATGPDNQFSRTLLDVRGKVMINDPIFPIYREATDGAKMFYGEFIVCSGGSSCRIVENSETARAAPVDMTARPWPDYSSDATWETTATNAKE